MHDLDVPLQCFASIPSVSTLGCLILFSTFTQFLPFEQPYSLVVSHLKLMSILFASVEPTFCGGEHFYEYVYAMGVKALEWMLHSSAALYFPFHSEVWSQDCCEFSHPQDMSYTLALHLNTGGAEKEGGGRGGGRGRGGEQDMSVKRREPVKGGRAWSLSE